MSELKDSLYDTRDAIALSLQLTGTATGDPKEDDADYIRFSAGPRVAAPSSRPPKAKEEEASSEPEISLPDEPFDNGEEMLKWCISTAGATDGFVTDSQGFVVMKEGASFPEDGMEGAGANLGMVVDQLNQMEIDSGDIQVADLIYQNRFMLVVRTRDKDGDIYNMGIIGSSPISTAQKKAIYQQVRRSLMQLAL